MMNSKYAEVVANAARRPERAAFVLKRLAEDGLLLSLIKVSLLVMAPEGEVLLWQVSPV